MAHVRSENLGPDRPIPETAKFVVVGAGMSGLYCTWRLNKEAGEDDIVVLERSNRTGGRLDSDLIEFADGDKVKEEEGGMRFTFDTMDDLMALFLSLPIPPEYDYPTGATISAAMVPFPMNSGGNNRRYFRGESFTNADAAADSFAIWTELYNLAPAERDINPTTILNTVLYRIFDVNPHFTAQPDHENRGPVFWQDFRIDCKWKDIPLYQWTLWDLFTDMGYSNECITLLYRLLGFNGTFLSKMNAGVAFQLLLDFPSDSQFRTLAEGFSMLPNALVHQVKMNEHGEKRIFLDTTITSIEQGVDGGYTVNYSQRQDDGSYRGHSIQCEKLILCLPKLALEKLFVRSNALNEVGNPQSERLWDTLQGTTDQPLLKINLYYDKAWWGNAISGQPPVAFGPNFSDLPTGSVYPFYSIDAEAAAALEYEGWLKQNGKEPSQEIASKLAVIDEKKYQKAAALTIYCDYANINFWSGLQSTGDKFDSPMQREYSSKCPQTIYPASNKVVETATKFFQQIFNTHYVPGPSLTSARIWEGTTLFSAPASDQFGYGVHQWALGANDREVIADLVEPLPDLYTCGEAYSDYQGWVEGALRSSDLVLDKFGLSRFSQVFEAEYGESSSAAIKTAYKLNSAKMIKKYIDPDFSPDLSTFDASLPCSEDEICCGVDLGYHDTTETA